MRAFFHAVFRFCKFLGQLLHSIVCSGRKSKDSRKDDKENISDEED